jgi:hypothetical protein
LNEHSENISYFSQTEKNSYESKKPTNAKTTMCENIKVEGIMLPKKPSSERQKLHYHVSSHMFNLDLKKTIT